MLFKFWFAECFSYNVMVAISAGSRVQEAVIKGWFQQTSTILIWITIGIGFKAIAILNRPPVCFYWISSHERHYWITELTLNTWHLCFQIGILVNINNNETSSEFTTEEKLNKCKYLPYNTSNITYTNKVRQSTVMMQKPR